jgi:uncharacterized ubiquitin-like protein YukD
MSFSPIQKEHHFRSFGTWLSDVTKVIPTDNSTIKKRLQEFSEAELDKLLDRHKVLHELPINKEHESLERVVTEVLNHLKSTGVLEGILLPFEEIKTRLIGVEKHSIRDVWLNYGEDGQGGQRNPKPRHILHMLRRWNPDGLTCGNARLNPEDGRIFVNEGQQRSIAGCIVGRTEFAYELLPSSDSVDDLRQFKRENQGKLRASEVELALSDALVIKKVIEPYCEKKKIDITDLTYAEVCKELKLNKADDEFVNFKIFMELSLKRNFRLVNDENREEKKLKGACTNLSQLKEIFENTDYTDDILTLSLDLYEYVWPLRRLETADLIGLLETIYFNKDWIFDKKFDLDLFKVKLMNSLREQWANKTSGKGSTTAWDQIQDEMKVQFPNKSKEDKEKNYKWYSQDSTRIAKHMWLGQGFYSVLSKRLPKEFSKKLVRPIRADGVAYDLDIPVIMKAENA